MAQARVELPTLAHSRVTIGSQLRWQDLMQVNYFGEGPGSLDADRSQYRLQSMNVGYVSGSELAIQHAVDGYYVRVRELRSLGYRVELLSLANGSPA